MLIQELRNRSATDEGLDEYVWESPPDVETTNALWCLTRQDGTQAAGCPGTQAGTRTGQERWTFTEDGKRDGAS